MGWGGVPGSELTGGCAGAAEGSVTLRQANVVSMLDSLVSTTRTDEICECLDVVRQCLAPPAAVHQPVLSPPAESSSLARAEHSPSPVLAKSNSSPRLVVRRGSLKSALETSPGAPVTKVPSQVPTSPLMD